jgi:hypothetical protein
MSYHTDNSNWDCSVVVCHLFLYSILSYVQQQLLSLDCQTFVRYNSLVFFYLSWELSWCKVSFLKGDLQFSKLFMNTICIGVCTLKRNDKRFIPFTPLHILP